MRAARRPVCRNGIYCGAVSGLPLFRGVDKYDSGSGWPSFTQPFDEEHIAKVLEPDGKRATAPGIRSLSS